jgi:hypothetical protein
MILRWDQSKPLLCHPERKAGSRYNPALVEKRIHFGPGAGIAREKLQDPNVARLMDCPF